MPLDLLKHYVGRLIEANPATFSQLGDFPQGDRRDGNRLAVGLGAFHRARLRTRETTAVAKPPQQRMRVQDQSHSEAFHSRVQSTLTMSPRMVRRSRSIPRRGVRVRPMGVMCAIGAPRLVIVSGS